jgi:large-conductance mechanosensitive channel
MNKKADAGTENFGETILVVIGFIALAAAIIFIMIRSLK